MRAQFLLLLLAASFLYSCGKDTEAFQTEQLSAYLPTQTGKYITYRIDSTIFTNFGATVTVRSYQEKHEIDAQINDNLGRPSFRVFRYIRDTNATTAWKPSGSYFITNVDKTMEVVENNLRFLKLAAPIREDYTWKGNRFLPTDPYGLFYEFSNDDAMMDWDYIYTQVGDSKTINNKTFANTITVEQIRDSINYPLTNSGAYGFINYSVDTYAKGVGLIQQEIRMYEYQPPSTPRPGFKGFGIKRKIIDHN